MKSRKMIVATVLLLGLALVSVPASGLGTCLDCKWTLGLYICIPAYDTNLGFRRCIAWTECIGGGCIEWCHRYDSCMFYE